MPGAVSRALSKNTPVLSLFILVSFLTLFLSVGYNLVGFSPQEFLERPEAEEYENGIARITRMDEWSRTQFYWSSNLEVAAFHALFFPTYSGFALNVVSCYEVGIAVAYHNGVGGLQRALAFTATVFIHGLLELTGLFLVMVAAFRLGWDFWKGMGHAAKLSFREPSLAKVWKKLFRGWKRIKLEALDFLILVGLGMLMIFLAGPIESYVSPRAMGVFLAEPLLAGAFLLAIGFFYSSLAYLGFRRMRENLRRVLEDLRLCVRGKFRSSQVSVLMLFVLLSVFFLAVVF